MEILSNLFWHGECKEHGVVNNKYPCPWPDCKNGIKSDQFQIESIVKDKPNEICTRRKWLSPLGGDYYSWDSDKILNWWFTGDVFWNEARRNGLINTTNPEVIYHYTSLEGFLGILQNDSLWMTDYSYLNDKKELAIGKERLGKVSKEMINTTSDPELKKLLKTWAKKINEMDERVCIASFSSNGDSLSQWRAYGQIAIGFDQRKLKHSVNESTLRPIEYNEDTQNKLIKVYLAHLCQTYLVDKNENRMKHNPDSYEDHYSIHRILKVLAFFKDSSFHSEEEYRLVYLESSKTIENNDFLKAPKKHFRVSNSHLYPYIISNEIFPMQDDDYPLGVTEIILGPEADDLMERGVKEFLESLNLGSIPIKRSKVPYRT